MVRIGEPMGATRPLWGIHDPCIRANPHENPRPSGNLRPLNKPYIISYFPQEITGQFPRNRSQI